MSRSHGYFEFDIRAHFMISPKAQGLTGLTIDPDNETAGSYRFGENSSIDLPPHCTRRILLVPCLEIERGHPRIRIKY